MSELTVADENFSDDSLESCNKPKKKVKQLRWNSKARLTYSQLYQRRLTSEYINTKIINFEENLSHPTRATSPCGDALRDVKERQDFNAESPLKCSLQSAKLKKRPVSLWSKFLSQKAKPQRKNSNADMKVEMLKKRLDYGKKMSSLNRFNAMCLKANKRGPSIKAASQIEGKSSLECLVKTESKRSKLKSQSIPADKPCKSAEKPSMKELQIKLQQLKLRHAKDKQIAEKVRCYMLNVSDELEATADT